MSYIFDALLKSETDREDSHGTHGESITEVLQRVESRAASQWKAESIEPRDQAATVRAAQEEPMEEVPDIGLPKAVAIIEEPDLRLDHFASVKVARPTDKSLVTHTEKESAAAEAFRLMAVRLRHIRKDRQLKQVLITSAVPSEGKSMVASNLACTLASSTNQKVLLLEGDIRRPALTELFQLADRPGLCAYLQDSSRLEQSICRLEDLGFWVLAVGKLNENSLGLIQSPRLPQLMDELQSMFDWIIIDTPPVLPLADTSVFAKLADGILLVTRRGVTQKKQMQRAIDALDRNKLLGAIINSSRKNTHDSYYYGYGAHSSTDSPGQSLRE